MKYTIVLILCLLASPVFAEVYFQDTFSGYADATAWTNTETWGKTSDTTLETSGCYSNKCIKMAYVDDWHEVSRSLGNGYPEGYLGFWAKVTNKQASWPKFLKFFGTNVPTDYANFTLGVASYTEARLAQFNFSDSNGPTGDGECRLRWTDGTINTGDGCVGTVTQSINQAFTFPDENWHHFVVYWKLNTNGNQDGAFGLWIDGTQYVSAVNVVNRADTNTRGFAQFTFGDYTSSLAVPTWYLWYDDVVIASTYDEAAGGEGDTTAPSGSLRSGVSASGVTFR